ncbi:c-type cytochrome biogenesis protein CcmI [Ruegeria sp. 2012CJ41-6]|uniref:C-type cytochrome biogenesis protein CcmI n=1 Tax=Ruegeria spongiae TaxID=2942209 RepID=A0ABT0Q4L9_9RHOB|nr:c-type cytochrome biogenesis protein CcmI [Ruegeria spongiae]MCL6284798.1 c-type cytochrome biogenesis protein CcmI [Ruegeria spongiae]
MTFWILISLTALVVAALLALTLLRCRSKDEPAAAYDLRVYREQLAGVDRDLVRGVIGESDADRIRTEISRRILAADALIRKESEGMAQPRRGTWVTALVLIAALMGGGLMLYRSLGAPGYGDLPLGLRKEMAEERRLNRPDQASAEAEQPERPAPNIDPKYAELMEQLRAAVASRPDDLQGHILLAQNEANLGNFSASYKAMADAIRLMGDDASADDHAEMAEMMIAAAGGYVSPQAETVLDQALDLDPDNGTALYYWGVMMLQIGRPDAAFRVWEEALRSNPAPAPWVDAIRARIGEVAARAGVKYDQPDVPALPGPSAQDMAGFENMAPDARADVIRNMVTGLSERLATEGGTAEEWARLIRSLGVLGEGAQANRVFHEAQQVFAGNDAALALIRQASQEADTAQ